MSEPRKPVVTTAGLDPYLARALEPVKQTLEMLTGARSGLRELKGVPKDATAEELAEAINSIVARLNASGKAR